MIYYLIYLSLGLLSIFTIYIKKGHEKYIMYIGTSIILLFQALRWRTGTDWSNYYNTFLHVFDSHSVDHLEKGFLSLNAIVRYLTDSYTIFLFIECGLNLLFIILFLKAMPIKNKVLALMYLFVIAIFPIRFTLASNIVIFGYKYILNKEFFKFLVIVLLAFSIHRTTIVILPFYFLVRKEYSLKLVIGIYLFCIILGMMTEFTYGQVIRYASAVYGHADSTVQGKMNAYISGEMPDYGEITPVKYILSLLNSTFFILFFYYFKQKKFKENLTFNTLYNLYLFGISINRIFFQLIPDFARITSLFSGGFIVMIIMIVSKYNKSVQVLATMAIIIYMFFAYYRSINGIYQDLFIPYYTIFTGHERIVVY